MCPLEGIVPPYPKIISNGSSDDVTFRVHLSATQVARTNKSIRAGDCGSIHTVQQDYKSAFAQWAAGNIAPASTSTSPPTTTTVPQESPGQYEAACTAAPPYGALASPTAQTGVCVTYQAQVFQYDANTGTTEMLVYVTNDGDSIWQDLVKLSLPQSVVSQDFIENDVIQFWGATAAPYSYTTEQNGTNTIPAVNVKYATLVSAASS
jgi:hypothetical protein